MEHPKSGIPRFGKVGFGFDLNLPDKRGDGADGVWHGEESRERQACVGQTRMNTSAGTTMPEPKGLSAFLVLAFTPGPLRRLKMLPECMAPQTLNRPSCVMHLHPDRFHRAPSWAPEEMVTTRAGALAASRPISRKEAMIEREGVLGDPATQDRHTRSSWPAWSAGLCDRTRGRGPAVAHQVRRSPRAVPWRVVPG